MATADQALDISVYDLNLILGMLDEVSSVMSLVLKLDLLILIYLNRVVLAIVVMAAVAVVAVMIVKMVRNVYGLLNIIQWWLI